MQHCCMNRNPVVPSCDFIPQASSTTTRPNITRITAKPLAGVDGCGDLGRRCQETDRSRRSQEIRARAVPAQDDLLPRSEADARGPRSLQPALRLRSRKTRTRAACPAIATCIRSSRKRTIRRRWCSAKAGTLIRRFFRQPPAITILRSVQVPPFGGDTTWANSALAYSMLSDTYREMIQNLKVRFSLRDVLKSVQEAVVESDSPIGQLASTRNSERLSDDLVRKISRQRASDGAHASGKRGEGAATSIPSYAIGIEGMEAEESAPILRLSRRAHHPARLQLPAPLGTGYARAVG